MNTETEVIEGEGIDPAILATVELTDEALTGVVSDIETLEAKTAAYAEAPADATDLSDAPVGAAPTPAAPTTTPKAPRISFTSKSAAILHKLGVDPEKAFILEASDADLDPAALTAKMEAMLAAIDTLPKKVAEKVANVFGVIVGKGRLSNYTGYVLNALADKGTLTSKEAFEVLKGRGYTDGTARAQSNQMFTVLPALGIATRTSKGLLTVNADSTLIDMLKGMVGKAATPATTAAAV